MDSFDSIEIGDTIVLYAHEYRGQICIPDVAIVDINDFPLRYETQVLGKCGPREESYTKKHGAILIALDSGNSFREYERFYPLNKRALSVPSPDEKYWEVYSPKNILNNPTQNKTRHTSNGMSCCECRNGYPMAEPNFGDKLVCWSCRDSLRWKYKMINGKVELV